MQSGDDCGEVEADQWFVCTCMFFKATEVVGL